MCRESHIDVGSGSLVAVMGEALAAAACKDTVRRGGDKALA